MSQPINKPAFVRLTSVIDNSPIVLSALSIVYVCVSRSQEWNGKTEVRTWFKVDHPVYVHHVTETPEQIFAMLEPGDPKVEVAGIRDLLAKHLAVQFETIRAACDRNMSAIDALSQEDGRLRREIKEALDRISK